MTTSCLIVLGISLALYLLASLLLQGRLWLGHASWEKWGHRLLMAGVVVHIAGIGLHVAFSGQSPLGNMTTVISLVVVAFLVVGMMIESRTSVRNLTLFLAPIAFLGLLYPLLMPVRFEDASSMLVRYPWLGVHVFITLLGHVGFALAFLGAAVYLLQRRALKRGRLNHYLPALDSASRVTFYSAAGGFFFFTIGLGMGAIWLFGAPGEYLGGTDAKIILAIPTWIGFALYLYARGVRGMYGSRLKWVVVVAFGIAVLNYVLVPHRFDIEEGTSHAEGALGVAAADPRPTPT